jgi:Glycosyltransferase 61
VWRFPLLAWRDRIRGALARIAFWLLDGFVSRHGPRRRAIHLAVRAGSFLAGDSTILPIAWLDDRTPTMRLADAGAGISVGPSLAGRSSVKSVTLPAVSLYALREVTLAAGAPAFASDGSILIERVPGVEVNRCSFLGGPVLAHGNSFAAIPQRRSVALESGFFLAGYGYSNWYHWMIEILPKLRFWQELPRALRAYPLLVGEDACAQTAFLEALAAFSSDADISVLKKDELYTVGHLLHINSPNPSPFNLRGINQMRVMDFFMRPSAIQDWRQRVGLDPRQRSTPNRQIFLARANDRRPYNQSEVLDMFCGSGFEPVYFDQMSLREQVDTMASARLIAGPTGAAWANLIFCTPGAKALCWMAEPYREYSAYSTIAHILGIDLRYLTYATNARSTGDLYATGYHLDMTTLERELAGLLVDAAG